jgi:hypothetical protein
LVYNYDEKICLKSSGVIIDIKELETKLKRLKFAA